MDPPSSSTARRRRFSALLQNWPGSDSSAASHVQSLGFGLGSDGNDDEDPSLPSDRLRHNHFRSRGENNFKDVLITKGDEYHGLKLLKFEVCSHDGGSFSSRYSVQNMLKADTSVYCTEVRENANIGLQFKPDMKENLDGPSTSARGTQNFVLTHVIIKAPKTGFTAPVKEGIIFVSTEPIDPEDTREFDFYTEEKYKRQVSDGRACDLTDRDPAAYFRIDQNLKQCEVSLAVPRYGSFILIKLLRGEALNQDATNIDIMYVGFKGWVQARKGFPTGTLL